MRAMNRRIELSRSLTAFATSTLAAVLLVLPQGSAAQSIGSPSVTDVTTCAVSTVKIARSPYLVRIQRFMPDGEIVLTLNGAFDSVPAGTTFHVTHVAGMFFTDSPQVSQVRLYRNGDIIATFNVGGDNFHLENSTTHVRTLNQPVDMNFRIGSPGEYDLQLIRSKSNGGATGIAEFWGYLTTDTCEIRPS